MKAFETWNEEQNIDIRCHDSSIQQFRAYVKEEREKVWRTALENILKNYPNFAKLEGLRNYIEKELEN